MIKKDIEFYTTGIFIEFAEFVTTNFTGIVTVEEFIETFINKFHNYKNSPYNQKLDIALLEEEKKISCVGSALIMGLWYLIKEGKEPIYYIENYDSYIQTLPWRPKISQTKRSSHIIVEIDQTLYELWKEKNNTRIFLRTLEEDDGRIQRIKKSGECTVINTTAKYLANRLSLFDLNDNAKKRLYEKKEEFEHCVNDYQLALNMINALE